MQLQSEMMILLFFSQLIIQFIDAKRESIANNQESN
jgi:hypothetical protein